MLASLPIKVLHQQAHLISSFTPTLQTVNILEFDPSRHIAMTVKVLGERVKLVTGSPGPGDVMEHDVTTAHIKVNMTAEEKERQTIHKMAIMCAQSRGQAPECAKMHEMKQRQRGMTMEPEDVERKQIGEARWDRIAQVKNRNKVLDEKRQQEGDGGSEASQQPQMRQGRRMLQVNAEGNSSKPSPFVFLSIFKWEVRGSGFVFCP